MNNVKRIPFLAVTLLILGGVSTVPVYGAGPVVPVSGKVVSASATITSSSSSDVVFTTPTKGSFLLTQLCASSNVGAPPISLSGNTFGNIAILASSPPSCVSFSPGSALPSNEALSCDFTCYTIPCAVPVIKPNIVCSISGVIEPKSDNQ